MNVPPTEAVLRLPEIDRVVYQRNPLQEVLCQVRFPRELSIDKSLPDQFQKEIKEEFPLFESRIVLVPEQLMQIDPTDALKNIAGRPHYDFVSLDRRQKVTLASDFAAITSIGYERWEKFEPSLSRMLNALRSVYSPSVYTRIGLRYVNVIDRDALSVSEVPWNELLAPHIAGIFASSDLVTGVDINKHTTVIIPLAVGKVTLNHGTVVNAQTEKVGYLIDFDVFSEGNQNADDIEQIVNVARAFNEEIGRLFRWCISPRLHAHLRAI
jgi:uncharacterized protein (TIGR04255 family)